MDIIDKLHSFYFDLVVQENKVTAAFSIINTAYCTVTVSLGAL